MIEWALFLTIVLDANHVTIREHFIRFDSVKTCIAYLKSDEYKSDIEDIVIDSGAINVFPRCKPRQAKHEISA